MTAATSTERARALRTARDSLGMRRREVCAHDDDWPAIKALAARLAKERRVRDRKKTEAVNG